MSTVKIVFVMPDKQIVIYGHDLWQLWQVESYVLEQVGRVLAQQQQEIQQANIRRYWIDDEGDQVEILKEADYDLLLKRAGSHRTPKIFFQALTMPTNAAEETAAQQSQQSQQAENLAVHETVSCDVCMKCPIVGFRYKCLECNNYDLCMKCEGEMKHKDHMMLRIPTYSSVGSAVCPAGVLFGSKRRQKKYAAACAAAAAAAGSTDEGAQPEGGKQRHYRHHRRHCGNGGLGMHQILSNFYDMMQGLAEGGAAPSTASAPESPEKTAAPPCETPLGDVAAEAAAAAAAAAMKAAEAANAAVAAAATPSATNMQSRETNTSPDRSANAAANGQEFRAGSASAPPSFENLQNLIDPQFMKAGIQILNNFSEMFGKILDPAVISDASRASSTGTPVAADIDLTASSSKASVSQQTGSGNSTPNKASAAASENMIPMETEVAAPTHTPTSSPRSEENDWTMIDNTVPGVTLPDAVTTSSSTDPAASAAAVSSASQPLDFNKLSQQLQSHIENEKNTPVPVVPSPTAPTPASTPTIVAPAVITLPATMPIPLPPPAADQTQASAPPPAPAAAPQPAERRAVAVYHPDQRINTAIHAMMAMGFSNEGAMLTQLLESVNGDIPLALDLMTNAQRT